MVGKPPFSSRGGKRVASNVTSNAILVTTPRQLQTRYFYTHCRDGKSSSGCWKPTFGEGKTCPSQKEKLWENSAALVMLNLSSHAAGCAHFKSPAGAENQGATSQPSHRGGRSEGSPARPQVCPWSSRAAQNCRAAASHALGLSAGLDGLVVPSLLGSTQAPKQSLGCGTGSCIRLKLKFQLRQHQ